MLEAKVIGVSTTKPSKFATLPKEVASFLIIWLRPVYGGRPGDTVIALVAFESVGAAFGEKCAAIPDQGLMMDIQQIPK